MSFKEFTDKVCKRYTKKDFKVKGSWGIYDSYKLVRKHGWYDIGKPLYESEYFGIVRKVNDLLADEIANGNTVVFPHAMGKLELNKFPVGVKIVNGKLKNTYPISWYKTLKLWYEDEEAYKNKILIRKEDDYAYAVRYKKFNAFYTNMCFYEFAVNRFIKNAIRKNVKEGKVDTLW